MSIEKFKENLCNCGKGKCNCDKCIDNDSNGLSIENLINMDNPENHNRNQSLIFGKKLNKSKKY